MLLVLLVLVYNLHVAVVEDANVSPFAADFALVVSTEMCLRRGLFPRDDEHANRLQLTRNSLCARSIRGPDIGGKTSR